MTNRRRTPRRPHTAQTVDCGEGVVIRQLGIVDLGNLPDAPGIGTRARQCPKHVGRKSTRRSRRWLLSRLAASRSCNPSFTAMTVTVACTVQRSAWVPVMLRRQLAILDLGIVINQGTRMHVPLILYDEFVPRTSLPRSCS
jgi:hypothetical protein